MSTSLLPRCAAVRADPCPGRRSLRCRRARALLRAGGVALLLCLPGAAALAAGADRYDLLIANGSIYDGSGGPPFAGDVAVRGDRIVALGDLDESAATTRIDAHGKAVSPGFINMMGWGVTSLIRDGRGLSDLTQGITLEVFGEGNSMGPLNDAMKASFPDYWDGIEAQWTTLGEYLQFLEARGVSPNVASFVGAATPRVHVLGMDDVAPTPQQLADMQALVRGAMREGALGVASSLIYTPGNFASTKELIALAEVAADYGGIYASHIRNEGAGIFEALEELLTIAREAQIPAEIYHLKLAHPSVWGRLDELVARIEAARAAGPRITADMYPYPAGSTGLDAIMPPWANAGGLDAWIARMQDPAVRERLRAEMREDSAQWENMLASAGAEAILLVGFRNPALQQYVGMTLAEVAAARGTPPEDTAMDLVIEDRSRVSAVFFTQSEDVVREVLKLPWVSFCTDARTVAAEGAFLDNALHPRGYGTFPRVLGRYVREEGLITLQEAVRKASALPAENLSLVDRGRLEVGYYADVVVFDPATIIDNATFENPHRYSSGVEQVLVNGTRVIVDGEHSGATPGRVVRGPGWVGWE